MADNTPGVDILSAPDQLTEQDRSRFAECHFRHTSSVLEFERAEAALRGAVEYRTRVAAEMASAAAALNGCNRMLMDAYGVRVGDEIDPLTGKIKRAPVTPVAAPIATTDLRPDPDPAERKGRRRAPKQPR